MLSTLRRTARKLRLPCSKMPSPIPMRLTWTWTMMTLELANPMANKAIRTPVRRKPTGCLMSYELSYPRPLLLLHHRYRDKRQVSQFLLALPTRRFDSWPWTSASPNGSTSNCASLSRTTERRCRFILLKTRHLAIGSSMTQSGSLLREYSTHPFQLAIEMPKWPKIWEKTSICPRSRKSGNGSKKMSSSQPSWTCRKILS